MFGWFRRQKNPVRPAQLDAAAIVRRARRLRFRVRPDAVSQLSGAYHGARPGIGLTFAELRAYAIGRGHKAGWAAHKFKEKHGSFPPWDWNSLSPEAPSMATLSWIRSRNIAWDKSHPRRVA